MQQSSTGGFVAPATIAVKQVKPTVKAVPQSLVTLAAALLTGVGTRTGLDSITNDTLSKIAEKAVALDVILSAKVN